MQKHTGLAWCNTTVLITLRHVWMTEYAGDKSRWSADSWQEVDGGPLPLAKMDIHVEEIMQVCSLA